MGLGFLEIHLSMLSYLKDEANAHAVKAQLLKVQPEGEEEGQLLNLVARFNFKANNY